MKSKQVYFHFYDLTTNTDYRIPLSCTDEEFDEWAEKDIEISESFIAELEETAVHDVSYVYREDYTLVGYTTYEASAKQMNELVMRWKEKLVELGWVNETDVFQALHIPQSEV